MNQIGKAFSMYVQDYDRIIPNGTNRYDAYAYGQLPPCEDMLQARCFYSVQYQLTPYIKNQQVWKDPSDSGDRPPLAQGVAAVSNYYNQFGSSYYYVMRRLNNFDQTQLAMSSDWERGVVADLRYSQMSSGLFFSKGGFAQKNRYTALLHHLAQGGVLSGERQPHLYRQLKIRGIVGGYLVLSRHSQHLVKHGLGRYYAYSNR